MQIRYHLLICLELLDIIFISVHIWCQIIHLFILNMFSFERVIYWTSEQIMYFVVNTNVAQMIKKVQEGKDQEKAQSEKDSHSKNRGGKKPN